ncbi:uncharacterized protein LOC125315042 isoform X1 [Rhodamnia argentea]|uniref:Uncharacterized protein LOC125315042 isoform X1 n=1 Tax=Rhodamnia argentea TaxID=178133 RepID=A0ABM3HE31_9MYRT|nr:uncharacterized protein LOC125315042 isoform X1 [Rhodamnia argentea]
MANGPSPLALLVQAFELTLQRYEDYLNALLIATNNCDYFEAQRNPKVSNARRACDDANNAYAAQVCRVLGEIRLVASSMEEIEALLAVVRSLQPGQVLTVEIQGPVPQGNVVDPLVAQMRAALEGEEGFRLRHGNIYDLLYPLPQGFMPAVQQVLGEQQALAQQQAGGRTSLRQL